MAPTGRSWNLLGSILVTSWATCWAPDSFRISETRTNFSSSLFLSSRSLQSLEYPSSRIPNSLLYLPNSAQRDLADLLVRSKVQLYASFTLVKNLFVLSHIAIFSCSPILYTLGSWHRSRRWRWWPFMVIVFQGVFYCSLAIPIFVTMN